MKITCEHLFPKPLWWLDLAIDLERVRRECYVIRDQHPEGKRGGSNKNGYQSSDLTNLNPDSAIANLMEEIRICSQKIYQIARKDSIKIDNCWININYQGSSNLIHTHPGALLSGVFYVKVPLDAINSGHLAFYRDYTESHVIHSAGKFKDNYKMDSTTASKTLFLPKENRLFIFPSWLGHGVEENKTNEERISLAFNLNKKSTN